MGLQTPGAQLGGVGQPVVGPCKVSHGDSSISKPLSLCVFHPALLSGLPSVVCQRILASFGFKSPLVQPLSPSPLLSSRIRLKVGCREMGLGLCHSMVADVGYAVGADGCWVQHGEDPQPLGAL